VDRVCFKPRPGTHAVSWSAQWTAWYNIGLVIPAEDMSAKVLFDFVRAPGDPVVDGRHLSHYIEWRGVILHCHAYAVPGRTASLGYRILG
jgi:hypothetical protein